MPRTKPEAAPGPRRAILAAVLLAALAAPACARNPGQGIPLATVADRRQWPSEAELTRLQPAGRDFDAGYGGQDVPLLLEPSARKIFCVKVKRKPLQLRCRYTLTVADWIGRNPPTREVEDLLQKDGTGRWRILELDVGGESHVNWKIR